MKIGIQTWGSDGDIRPFAALAGGLVAAGHQVTLVYTSFDNKDYSALAGTMGFQIRRAHDHFDLSEVVLAKLTRGVMKERIPLRQLQIIMDEFYVPAIDEMYRASQRLCSENDLVIGHWIIHTLIAAAEKAPTPYISVMLNHGGIPSRFLTPIGLPNVGQWFNPIWWRLVNLIVNWGLKPYFEPLRKKEGLPLPADIMGEGWESKLLNLIAVSPTLCPRPPDWGEHHQICGFFNMPEQAEPWEVPGALRDFLGAGPTPIYLTFGSLMPILEQELRETLALMVEAVKQAGCRAIIQSSLAGAGDFCSNERIYHLSKVPHQRIFPLCAVIVHHGGAGTTQTATRAGIPSIVVEHIVDQVLWGNELQRRGIAPKVLHRRSLTPRKLAEAIRVVLASSRMREQAVTIGAALDHEDGVEKAILLIEKAMTR
ncbi:MAG: hypothetical protein KJ950_02070 [Proteobacteria bacterium]|nr:hypothetical protein [Pseudomonadota bacterium]MBU1687819.1 hypothetical protein [Pseudomonadota bacterium]